MSKKLTYEFVKEKFNEEGYVLVSTEYINSITKLNCICSNGHKWATTWTNWKRGNRCAVCSGNNIITYSLVKKAFNDEGYTLLSKEYINSRTNLDCICNEGHNYSIRWANWQQGIRCRHCMFDRQRININFIRDSLSEEGYFLLSNVYKNAHTKFKYKCPEGHVNFTHWNGWKNGYRCPTCYSLNNFGENHPNWKGGISCEPYCKDWTKEYKKYIKDRDGNKCLNPDCWKTDKRLHIHHINYNKQDCDQENLITLCGSCNVRANFNRDWHTAWYKAIINKRYTKS